MTTPDQPVDLLSGGSEPRARTWRPLAVAAAGLLTAGVVGGAVYAGSALSGGGVQPEDVLPRAAIGFVKVDLDPSAAQKLAAYSLARQFPGSGVGDEAALRDDLVRTVLGGDGGVDYDADVRPWLGRRAGISFLPPDAGSPDEPVVVAAVQYEDREQAEAGLRRLAAEAGEDGERLGFAFAQDYVLLAEDQEVVDRAAGEREHLADAPGFDRAVRALDGDQIALGWLDLGALWAAVPEAERRAAYDGRQVDVSGLAVLGAHVADGTVEVLGRTLDLQAGPAPELQALLDSPLGRSPSTGLLAGLPADSAFAASISGLGPGLAALHDTFREQVEAEEGVSWLTDELGVELPRDLETLFGDDLAVSVGGDLPDDPRVGVRVRSGDPERAVGLLQAARDRLAQESGEELDGVQVEQVDGGWAATYGMPASALTTGTLGENEVFRRTVPDAGTSGLTYYLDVRRVVALVDAVDGSSAQQPPAGSQEAPGDGVLTPQQRRDLQPLEAVGYTTRVEADGQLSFRLRLAVQE